MKLLLRKSNELIRQVKKLPRYTENWNLQSAVEMLEMELLEYENPPASIEEKRQKELWADVNDISNTLDTGDYYEWLEKVMCKYLILKKE